MANPLIENVAPRVLYFSTAPWRQILLGLGLESIPPTPSGVRDALAALYPAAVQGGVFNSLVELEARHPAAGLADGSVAWLLDPPNDVGSVSLPQTFRVAVVVGGGWIAVPDTVTQDSADGIFDWLGRAFDTVRNESGVGNPYRVWTYTARDVAPGVDGLRMGAVPLNPTASVFATVRDTLPNGVNEGVIGRERGFLDPLSRWQDASPGVLGVDYDISIDVVTGLITLTCITPGSSIALQIPGLFPAGNMGITLGQWDASALVAGDKVSYTIEGDDTIGGANTISVVADPGTSPNWMRAAGGPPADVGPVPVSLATRRYISAFLQSFAGTATIISESGVAQAETIATVPVAQSGIAQRVDMSSVAGGAVVTLRTATGVAYDLT